MSSMQKISKKRIKGLFCVFNAVSWNNCLSLCVGLTILNTFSTYIDVNSLKTTHLLFV